MANTNSQNTVQGTETGGDLIYSNGNPILAGLAALSNVTKTLSQTANTGLDALTSFKERFYILKQTTSEKYKSPAQTTPAFQVSSIADWLSNPENVKKVSIGVTLVFGALIAVKYLRKK